jgi:ribose transport system substrate-binding protein
VVKDLAKQNNAVHVVDSKIANWELQTAQDATANFITASPNMNLVVAANNQMAQGAVNAISAANKTGKIEVATYDVDPVTIQNIIAGKITFATGFEPWGIGTGTMESAINLAEGHYTNEFQAPLYVVTKANAAKVLTELHSSSS